jgi:Predicted flavin-nucleotide-binding protein
MAVQFRVKRSPERASYDREKAFRILDESLIGHVAFCMKEIPYNIPMIYARKDDDLIVHSSIKSRFHTVLATGIPVCLASTLLDGIVLAKSPFHSSMNYRSAMVFGKASEIRGQNDKIEASQLITEKMVRGRWADCRQPDEGELKVTGFLKIHIDNFSVKARSGDPIEGPDDINERYWSGIIPLNLMRGKAITSELDSGKIDVPEYLMK